MSHSCVHVPLSVDIEHKRDRGRVKGRGEGGEGKREVEVVKETAVVVALCDEPQLCPRTIICGYTTQKR